MPISNETQPTATDLWTRLSGAFAIGVTLYGICTRLWKGKRKEIKTEGVDIEAAKSMPTMFLATLANYEQQVKRLDEQYQKQLGEIREHYEEQIGELKMEYADASRRHAEQIRISDARDEFREAEHAKVLEEVYSLRAQVKALQDRLDP